MGWIRQHLTYANTLSTLCLFLLLGGGAYAAFHLPKNSVRSKNIVNGAVKGKDVKKSAITSRKVAKNSLRLDDLGDIDASQVLKLSVGERQTILTQGPFSLEAACLHPEGTPEGFIAAVVFARSTDPNALYSSVLAGGGRIDNTNTADPDGPSVIGLTRNDSGPVTRTDVYTLVEASGNTVRGIDSTGVYALGADCVFSAEGISAGQASG